MTASPAVVSPVSIQDHLARVACIREVAMALPVERVKEPDVPVPVFVDEGFTAVAAARAHFPALAAVGLDQQTVEDAELRVRALQSAQALWNTKRARGRTEDGLRALECAEELRQDTLESGDLALRKKKDGQARLSAIREGEGLADLMSDLSDLGMVLVEFRTDFEAIKMDVDARAAELTQARDALQDLLALEDISRGLDTSKDLRDRVYVLCLEPLSELRAFAAHAFRHDRTRERIAPFMSAHVRRQNQKARAKKSQPA